MTETKGKSMRMAVGAVALVAVVALILGVIGLIHSNNPKGNANLTIGEQVSNVNDALSELEAVKTELKGYIDTLEATAQKLETDLETANAAIDALAADLRGQEDDKEIDMDHLEAAKAELNGKITESEKKVLDELNTVKTTLEAQLTTVNNTTSVLQTKHTELGQQLADLKLYADTELKSTKDWVAATYATLAQYEEIQQTISAINALITSTQADIVALEDRLNRKIAEDIATALGGVQTNLQTKIDTINTEMDSIKSHLDLVDQDISAIKLQLDSINGANNNLGMVVSYAAQVLTEAQKEQARKNIGAASEDDVKYEKTKIEDITATLSQNRTVVLKNGTVNTDNLGFSTEPLDVREGEEYLISGAYGGWFVLVAEYDATGAFVGYVGDPDVSWTIAYSKEYVVPAGVTKIVVCSHQADPTDTSLIKVEKVTKTSTSVKDKVTELDSIINAPFDSNGLPCVRLYGDVSNMSKENAVKLDYEYEGRTGTCTVKWQGSGSLQYPKKNYTIKFDTAFEAQEGWGEEKKYCLKADWADFSHARNLGAAKLWGEVVKSRTTPNTKLNSLVNGGAVDGFPCCVFINDEYIGLYTFNIPKDGWMLGMGDGTQEAIVCADFYIGNTASSFRSEATISEDGAEVGDDFSLEYVTDEDNAEWVTESLNRLINACINSDGTDLDTTIAQYLDWDSAIDYYIFTALLCNHDGMRHNYLLSTYDGVKWFFTAYDMDTTFGSYEGGRTWLSCDTNAAKLYNFSDLHRVMELIELYKKDELKARYKELRQGVLSESNVVALFSNYCAQFPKALFDEEVKIWSGIPGTSVNNFAQIIDYYRGRCEVIDKEIENL